MNVQELERAKSNVRVDIRRAELGEHQSPETPSQESIVLYLPPSGPPCAMLTDEEGRVTPKVISYLDLLYTLEESAILEDLKEDSVRHAPLPALPSGTLLVDLFQSPSNTDYAITGIVEPDTHLFILEEGDEIVTYDLPMPRVVWRALWNQDARSLKNLSIAFVSPDHEGPVTPATELYHYPFEHVYAGNGSQVERVCWPALNNMRIEPRDIPEKAVIGFLNSPNIAGHARKIDTLLSESGIDTPHELLTEIERRGSIPHDWLTPAALNVQQLHDQQRRDS
jgi:hypothetical protein